MGGTDTPLSQLEISKGNWSHNQDYTDSYIAVFVLGIPPSEFRSWDESDRAEVHAVVDAHSKMTAYDRQHTAMKNEENAAIRDALRNANGVR